MDTQTWIPFLKGFSERERGESMCLSIHSCGFMCLGACTEVCLFLWQTDFRCLLFLTIFKNIILFYGRSLVFHFMHVHTIFCLPSFFHLHLLYLQIFPFIYQFVFVSYPIEVSQGHQCDSEFGTNDESLLGSAVSIELDMSSLSKRPLVALRSGSFSLHI